VIAALPDLTSKEEEKRLHRENTICGNVRHGTKAIDDSSGWAVAWRVAEQGSSWAASASPTAFSGATMPGRESMP